MNFRSYYVLMERQDYRAMFTDLLAADPKKEVVVDELIRWARSNLKRNDRIVWFLRWVRVLGVGKPATAAAQGVELARLNKRLRTAYTTADLTPSVQVLKTRLQHFMGLPAPAIQAVVWDRQTPPALLEEFAEMEAQWQEIAADDADAREMDAQGRLLPTADKVVLQFPDGFAWFDLERPTCSAEARAMGHCGNAGGRGGDTILSLRRPVTLHGETQWYPVLTFILDPNGMLGEMKGRGNDKPAERYHPYIVALLKSPLVKGIKGGGYLPEHNFSLNDLDPATRRELEEQKPALRGVEGLYAEEGMTPRVLEMLDAALDARGIRPGRYDAEEKQFIVDSWSNLEAFARDQDDTIVEALLAILDGTASFMPVTDDPVVRFAATLGELPEDWQMRALARAGLANRRPTSDDLNFAARILARSNDDWYARFEDVLHNDQRIIDEAWERLALYVETGWYMEAYQVYLNIPRDLDALKTFVLSGQGVEAVISERDMMIFASSSEDDDDEYGYALSAIRRNGWAVVDWENTWEHRDEEGLVDRSARYRTDRRSDGGDKWLAGIPTDDDEYRLADALMAAINGHGPTGGRIIDPRQHELRFESALRRLRDLAGLAIL